MSTQNTQPQPTTSTTTTTRVLTPNGADLKSFFMGPSFHISQKYQSSQSSILALIYTSFFLFIWQIIILATIWGSIAFIAIGQVWTALLAISGYASGYLSPWFFVFYVIDWILLIVTFVRGTYYNANLGWVIIACLIWAFVNISQGVFIYRLRTAAATLK